MQIKYFHLHNTPLPQYMTFDTFLEYFTDNIKLFKFTTQDGVTRLSLSNGNIHIVFNTNNRDDSLKYNWKYKISTSDKLILIENYKTTKHFYVLAKLLYTTLNIKTAILLGIIKQLGTFKIHINSYTTMIIPQGNQFIYNFIKTNKYTRITHTSDNTVVFTNVNRGYVIIGQYMLDDKLYQQQVLNAINKLTKKQIIQLCRYIVDIQNNNNSFTNIVKKLSPDTLTKKELNISTNIIKSYIVDLFKHLITEQDISLCNYSVTDCTDWLLSNYLEECSS